MRAATLKVRQILNLDKLGISLSLLCAIHCLLTPVVVIALPVVAGRAFENPLLHWLLAVLILPVGIWAFLTGYRHHGKSRVFFLGIPGLLIVGLVPIFMPEGVNVWLVPLLMILGSALVISAHWYNRKSCSCEMHRG